MRKLLRKSSEADVEEESVKENDETTTISSINKDEVPSEIKNKTTVSDDPEESDDVEKEEETYFCSELIATLYKLVGLVETSRACSTYWPCNFFLFFFFFLK